MSDIDARCVCIGEIGSNPLCERHSSPEWKRLKDAAEVYRAAAALSPAERELVDAWHHWRQRGLISDWPRDQVMAAYHAFCAGWVSGRDELMRKVPTP